MIVKQRGAPKRIRPEQLEVNGINGGIDGFFRYQKSAILDVALPAHAIISREALVAPIGYNSFLKHFVGKLREVFLIGEYADGTQAARGELGIACLKNYDFAVHCL